MADPNDKGRIAQGPLAQAMKAGAQVGAPAAVAQPPQQAGTTQPLEEPVMGTQKKAALDQGALKSSVVPLLVKDVEDGNLDMERRKKSLKILMEVGELKDIDSIGRFCFDSPEYSTNGADMKRAVLKELTPVFFEGMVRHGQDGADVYAKLLGNQYLSKFHLCHGLYYELAILNFPDWSVRFLQFIREQNVYPAEKIAEAIHLICLRDLGIKT